MPRAIGVLVRHCRIMTEANPIETLSRRIAARLREVGLSERQASLQATGQPDALRYIRTRGAMPSTERLFKIAEVLKADPSYLWGHTDENNYEQIKDSLDIARAMSPTALRQLGGSEDQELTAPCMQTYDGGFVEAFSLDGEANVRIRVCHTFGKIVHLLSIPQSLRSGSFMGYPVINDALSPLYSSGDFILIDMDNKPKVGDIAFVDLGLSESGEHTVSFLAKSIGRTKERFTFEQFNPHAMFQIDAEVISEFHRVVPYGDLVRL